MSGSRSARCLRLVIQFTPTSGSWPKALETVLSALTRHPLKHGRSSSIRDLQATTSRRIAEHHDDPKP